jgi:hypothetical protein
MQQAHRLFPPDPSDNAVTVAFSRVMLALLLACCALAGVRDAMRLAEPLAAIVGCRGKRRGAASITRCDLRSSCPRAAHVVAEVGALLRTCATVGITRLSQTDTGRQFKALQNRYGALLVPRDSSRARAAKATLHRRTRRVSRVHVAAGNDGARTRWLSTAAIRCHDATHGMWCEKKRIGWQSRATAAARVHGHGERHHLLAVCHVWQSHGTRRVGTRIRGVCVRGMCAKVDVNHARVMCAHRVDLHTPHQRNGVPKLHGQS